MHFGSFFCSLAHKIFSVTCFSHVFGDMVKKVIFRSEKWMKLSRGSTDMNIIRPVCTPWQDASSNTLFFVSGSESVTQTCVLGPTIVGSKKKVLPGNFTMGIMLLLTLVAGRSRRQALLLKHFQAPLFQANVSELLMVYHTFRWLYPNE